MEVPYTGPFLVLSHHGKYFTIQISDAVYSNVTIDRLKPGHISKPVKSKDSVGSNPELNNSPPCSDESIDNRQNTITKSGRTLRWRNENTFLLLEQIRKHQNSVYWDGSYIVMLEQCKEPEVISRNDRNKVVRLRLDALFRTNKKKNLKTN